MTVEIDRQPRVRFKYPVRVVPLNGQPRAWRTLSANISKKGMFLRMPEPLETGTRVALSFEANGQVLPFAKAEVVWKRLQQSKFPDRNTGFGVRFTEYLHPRAEELVGYLCENLDTGRPLKVARRGWTAPLKALGAIAAAFVLGFSGIALWHFLTVDEPADAAVEMAVDEQAPVEAAIATPVETAPVEEAVAAAPTPAPVPTELAAAPTVEVTPVPTVAAPVPVQLTPTPVATPDVDLQPLQKPTEPPVAEARPVLPVEAQAPKAATATPGSHGSVSLPSGAAARLAWKLDGNTVHFELIGRPGSRVTKVFAMHSPERLVFDIDGSKPKQSRTVKTDVAHLSQVRIGARKNATRLVLDFADAPVKIDAAGTAANVEFTAN